MNNRIRPYAPPVLILSGPADVLWETLLWACGCRVNWFLRLNDAGTLSWSSSKVLCRTHRKLAKEISDAKRDGNA